MELALALVSALARRALGLIPAVVCFFDLLGLLIHFHPQQCLDLECRRRLAGSASLDDRAGEGGEGGEGKRGSPPSPSHSPAPHSTHFLALSVDAASGVITAMVDGLLCDGGQGQQSQRQGWVQMPNPTPLRFADVVVGSGSGGGGGGGGGGGAEVGPLAAPLLDLRLYGRYLRTAEMLGGWRAGPPVVASA